MESSRGSLSILSRLSALKTQAPPLPLRCAEGLVVIWGCWGHWGGTVVPFAGATGLLGSVGVLRQFRHVRWRAVVFVLFVLSVLFRSACAGFAGWLAFWAGFRYNGEKTKEFL